MGKGGVGADSGKEKAGQEAAKKSEASKKAGPDSAKKEDKKKTAEGAEAESSKGALSRLRQRRPFFFCVYIASCAWLAGTYDACDVKGKKQDCGHSGISTVDCMSTACFMKGAGKMQKKKVKLEPQGNPLGLSVTADGNSDSLTVTAVTGAAAEHNSQASPEEQILVGDSITKVGTSGSLGDMKKALLKTDKAVQLSVQRLKLPWFLTWLRTGGKEPSFLEKLATSPGFQRWSRSASYISGYGLLCWLLSGYPPASLPIYYFSLSGATAFMLTRCCYDEGVEPGVPHCYKGKSPQVEDAIMEAWAKTTKTLAAVYKDVSKDPKKYFKSFVPKGLSL